MELNEALHHLNARRKAKRLQRLWPAIEERIAQGVSHAEILGLLNDNGFELTERTYKSYLYRYRKRRRGAGQARAPMRLTQYTQPQCGDVAQTTALPAPSEIQPPQRPPTFDFDPRGIPELLK